MMLFDDHGIRYNKKVYGNQKNYIKHIARLSNVVIPYMAMKEAVSKGWLKIERVDK